MAKQKKNLPGPYMPKNAKASTWFCSYQFIFSLPWRSPDGKVLDPSTDSKYGLLEIKCPFSEIGETLDQAAADPNVYLEKVGGTFFLKKEHTKYRDKYIICQTQMKCVFTEFTLIHTIGQISSCQNYHNFICIMHCNSLLVEQGQ